MSIRCIDRVFKHSKARGSALLLLLAIADYANDAGTGAFPSVATLAKKTRMDRRHVQRARHKLQDMGELWVGYGASGYKTNTYTILVGGDTCTAPLRQIDQGGGDTCTAPGATPVPPNTSLNPSLNPEEREDRASSRAAPKPKYISGPYSETVEH